jgi:hypothetical protein
MSSTTPVTPAPTPPVTQPSTIVSVVARDWSWFVSHLVALVIVIGISIGGIYALESLNAKRDAATLAKDNAALATVVAQNQTLIAEAQSKDALLQQAITALSAANAQLSAKQTARNTQLATQVKTDATLSAQQAADRLTQQTNAAPGEITASGDTVVADLPMSRTIVTDLDELPVATANLADTQKQLANETEIATTAEADVTAQKAEIAGLNMQLADSAVACAAEVKTEKAKARKGKLKWFGIGFIVGFASGASAHIW